jgi:hypothetical protein
MKISTLLAVSTLAAVLAVPRARADAPAALPTPNAIVYVQQLPTPAELSKNAAAQGMKVEQISQTANQITIVYRLADGRTNTVAYQPLAAVDSTAVLNQTVATPATPAPAVVYTTAAPVYDPYYDYYPYWGWWPPVAVSLGFGFHDGWGGGFHHGWGGFHGGGFHR